MMRHLSDEAALELAEEPEVGDLAGAVAVARQLEIAGRRPADVRDVSVGVIVVADHHELLVVRAAGPHAHVPQALPTRCQWDRQGSPRT
mgnify:CR=1 FL=1